MLVPTMMDKLMKTTHSKATPNYSIDQKPLDIFRCTWEVALISWNDELIKKAAGRLKSIWINAELNGVKMCSIVRL